MKRIFKFFRNLIGLSVWTVIVAALGTIAGCVLSVVGMVAARGYDVPEKKESEEVSSEEA